MEPKSEKLQIVFFHIPKTGGTTFKEILMKNNPNGSYHHLKNEGEKAEFSLILQKLEEHDLVFGHFRFVPELVDDSHFLMTFLRNPADRVVSNFLHFKRDGKILHGGGIMAQFERFLSDDEMERNGSLNLQTQYMVGNVKSRDFNLNTDKYFKQACDNLNKLSFVGITEQFRDSAFMLCQTFGWKKWYYMPQNVSQNKKQIHLLKTNFSSRIAQLNELDQELYDRGLAIFKNQKRKSKIPLLKKYEAISLGYLKQLLKGKH